MKPCNLSADALYTVLLHAAKHPTSAVSGLLLGAVSGEGVEVAQALPVCHGFITLTPLLEAAMVQAEQYAKEQQSAHPGLRLVGYYQCNERLADGELGAGRRVADRLEAACPDAVALVLDGAALEAALKASQASGAESGQSVFHLYSKDGARGWVKAASSKGGAIRCPSGDVAAQLAQYTGQGLHQQVADFEEHLEDLGQDWLNAGLLQGPA
ncbi:hypothetical protein ABPG77_004051 [Micractinium sp. CCAP 211/92]